VKYDGYYISILKGLYNITDVTVIARILMALVTYAIYSSLSYSIHSDSKMNHFITFRKYQFRLKEWRRNYEDATKSPYTFIYYR